MKNNLIYFAGNKKNNEVKSLTDRNNNRFSRFFYFLTLPATAIIAFMIAITSLSTGCASNNQTDSFEVGVAIVDITPPIGHPQYRGESTGVASPLYAKALIFRQGDNHGALLVCDIIGIPRDLSRIVREQASSKTGIDFQDISISATHTHAGPRFSVQEYADREAAGQLTQEDRESYVGQLVENMIESIVLANDRLQEVEPVAGIGHADDLSYNRRFLMTNGRVRFNPGYLNPDIVRPVGPIDPDVHFVMFRPKNQDNFNTSLTVFANHTDTQGGTEFHADYPYHLQEHLKELFGEQLISVFGNGTCGDLNHVDVTRPAEATRRAWITEKIGRELAKAIKEAFPSARRLEPDFKVVSKTVYLPLQDYTEAEYEWAIDENAPPLYPDRPWLVGRRRGKIRSLEQIRQRDAIPPSASGEPWRLPLEIHVFRLDRETAIVTIPGEVLVELGLDLKKQSPFANTMVIELANATISYVPTLRAFAEGDYEALNSRLAPGSGEEMVDEAVRLLNDIFPGR